MGQTPRYQIPWPVGTDPPDGPAQLQALAEATEAAIAPIDDREPPTPPPPVAAGNAWIKTNLSAANIPAASVSMKFYLSSGAMTNYQAPAHISGTSFIIDTPGVYLVIAIFHINIAVVTSGAAYVALEIQTPSPTVAENYRLPVNGGIAASGTAMLSSLQNLPAGRDIGVSATNPTSAQQNMTSGSLTLIRISPSP